MKYHDIALATGQYPVCCPEGSFDVRHKTAIYRGLQRVANIMIQHFTTKSYFMIMHASACISLHPGVRVERCCSHKGEVCDTEII